MPSLTESETPSTAGLTASGRGSTRQRGRAMTTFVQVTTHFPQTKLNYLFIACSLWKDVLYTLRSRWHGMQAVRRAEHRIPFDLCN
jgi:hypothetical protein